MTKSHAIREDSVYLSLVEIKDLSFLMEINTVPNQRKVQMTLVWNRPESNRATGHGVAWDGIFVQFRFFTFYVIFVIHINM